MSRPPRRVSRDRAAADPAAALAQALSLIELLAGEVGPRRPTSRSEAVAAELLRERLAGAGLEASVEEFRGYASFGYPFGLIQAAAIAAGADPCSPAAPALDPRPARRRRPRRGGVAARPAPLASPLPQPERQRRRYRRAGGRGGPDSVPDGAHGLLPQRTDLRSALRLDARRMDLAAERRRHRAGAGRAAARRLRPRPAGAAGHSRDPRCRPGLARSSARSGGSTSPAPTTTLRAARSRRRSPPR